MDRQNRQQAVLVTGASTGIGEACARHLDDLGLTVYAGVRTEEDADRLEQSGSERLIPVFLDITDPDSIREACRDLTKDLGKAGLYGLVNNAGVVKAGPVEYLPIKALREQFEINVFGQIAVTQAFLPLIRQAADQNHPHHPRIINMSSIAGRSTLPFVGAYSSSKHALEALSDSLRLELKPWGIHVALIEPGAIATPIWQKAEADATRLFEDSSEEAHRRYRPAMEMIREHSAKSARRGIHPEVVAKAVAHALTSARPKIRYVVGTDAMMRVIANTLPDALQDWLILNYLGLKKPES